MDKDPTPKPIYKSLYFQVITAIVIGVLLGHFYPQTGEAMKPLGDGFIKLIKMIIAPIIFCTVVVGIAGMEDMKKVGKTGGLASGLQSGCIKPGGGPGATVGSIGTGGGSNANQPTGDSARNNMDEDVG